MSKKKQKIDPIESEEKYVEFLRKRVQSDNYKASVDQEEFNKTKAKYDKAKLKLRFLKMKP
tara:strand:- start:219 stop:401 length:183 start_codon:yes stop_codon:yes gene_type:complete